MSWDHRYRRLNFGEIIQPGDEVDVCNDGWRDPPKWVPAENTIGQAAPDPFYPSHRVYRRKKTAEWDSYYRNLPEDLKKKLSVHDFKRLGDVFMDAFNNSPDIASDNCQPQTKEDKHVSD